MLYIYIYKGLLYLVFFPVYKSDEFKISEAIPLHSKLKLLLCNTNNIKYK